MTANTWNWEGWNFIIGKSKLGYDETQSQADEVETLFSTALQKLYVAAGLTQEDLKTDVLKEHVDSTNDIKTDEYRFSKIQTEAHRITGLGKNFTIWTISPEVNALY